jgi:hypothetical protein
LAAAAGKRERMKLIIAQILAMLLEKWQSYLELKKQRYRPARNTLIIELRKFWSKYERDALIITAATIVALVLFLFGAYVITRF